MIRARGRAFEGRAESADPRFPVELFKSCGHRSAVLRKRQGSAPAASGPPGYVVDPHEPLRGWVVLVGPETESGVRNRLNAGRCVGGQAPANRTRALGTRAGGRAADDSQRAPLVLVARRGEPRRGACRPRPLRWSDRGRLHTGRRRNRRRTSPTRAPYRQHRSHASLRKSAHACMSVARRANRSDLA